MKEGAPKPRIFDQVLEHEKARWSVPQFETFLLKQAVDIADDVRAVNTLLGTERLVSLSASEENLDALERELAVARDSKVDEARRIADLLKDGDRLMRIMLLVRRWKNQSE